MTAEAIEVRSDKQSVPKAFLSVEDLRVIMGVTIVAAIFLVLANVIVDVLYAVVDPRVSYV